MKVDGECHCRKIAYEAEVDPATAAICHCTDCQNFSGSPYRASVAAKDGNFRILRGTPKIYVKTAQSGTKRAQAFCGDCGSPIYSAAPENPTQFNLRLGGLKQRLHLKPTKQIWCRSALEWAQDVTGIRGLPEG
jgi:hypothetical protein